MRLLVTTILRHAPPGVPSGFVSLVDLPGGAIVSRAAVPDSPWRRQDRNPRGGLRGAKGISFSGERLALASTDCVYVFDARWRLQRSISHPLAAGLHDILADAQGVWVTATHADLLLRFDWAGNLQETWDWRTCSLLRERFDLPRIAPVDQSRDYRPPDVSRRLRANTVHLNGVACDEGEGGGVLLSLGRIVTRQTMSRLGMEALYQRPAEMLGLRPVARFSLFHLLARKGLCGVKNLYEGCSSAVVRLGGDRTASILRQTFDIEEPNHNVLRMGDRLLYCETARDRLVIASLSARQTDRTCTIPGDPPFARGLAVAGKEAVWVGSQGPPAIYRVDLERAEIIERYELPFPGEAVYAIAAVPEEFAAPPEEVSFAAR